MTPPERLQDVIAEMREASDCGMLVGPANLDPWIARLEALAQQVPADGEWVLVPREPTREMIEAGIMFGNSPNKACIIYQSMLAATPQAPQPVVDKVVVGVDWSAEALQDLRLYGQTWSKDGKRIPPEEIYIDADGSARTTQPQQGAVAWDEGSPCSTEPRPVGMVYPPKPKPRASGYLDDSGVRWNAYDTAQMEAYARDAVASYPYTTVGPQAVDDVGTCCACYGKGWNDEWKKVSGHYMGGEAFRVECQRCEGTGLAPPAPAATPQAMDDAMKGVLASLAAAISLLERGGKKAAPSNRMFEQMLADYRKAVEQARAALAAHGKGG